MKKQFIAIFAALFMFLGAVTAQDAAKPVRMTTEEKVSAAMDKIEANLKPTEAVRESAKAILYDFYNDQQKAMQEFRASGNQNREDFMKIRQELADKRDAKLKAVFTAEQMTKWSQEVEPSLNPQRKKVDEKEKQ
jgi:hypothetical protein